MAQGGEFGRQVTVHWGAAAIGGIFLVMAGLAGGRVWTVRLQPTDSPTDGRGRVDDAIPARDAKVQDLQRHILNLEQQSASGQADLRKQIASLREMLAAKDLELQRLRTGNPGTNPGSAPTPPRKGIAKQEEGGIRFELLGCRAYGSAVTCEFLAESVNGDQWIQLHGSRMVSTDGMEFSAVGGSLGTTRSSYDATLPEGVPFRGSLQFSGVKPGSGIKLLEIGFEFMSARSYRVKFRDVPLD